MRGVAGLHLALVLAQGDVADPVEAVFNRPVAAAETKQASRTACRGERLVMP